MLGVLEICHTSEPCCGQLLYKDFVYPFFYLIGLRHLHRQGKDEEDGVLEMSHSWNAKAGLKSYLWHWT